MRADRDKKTFAYLRLSREEAQSGESASIKNQRLMITNYCTQHGLNLVRTFVDDGWSGGNFERPGFQEMMRELEKGRADIVITKDLSRLGRDMVEASYYAEQYYPEHGIRYIAIADNFDTEHENIMAPFQFAMNEVYLRDGSRKVKDVLRTKREQGQYCACPPYGYKKEKGNKNHLVPDEVTAPVVKRIFRQAANGDSSRRIALDLNQDGIIPPLKYRVLYRDDFSEVGASRMSDIWNYTTVKRILKNRVYLGHTVLGRSRKVSVKSKKKVAIPKEDWAVTENTHEALVTTEIFELAQENLGRGTSCYKAYDHVRKSIFSGIAVCSKCGYSLCSCGTVYKGEREKYWFLSCTHQRKEIANPCDGVRIRYADLVEVVRQELSYVISLSDDQIQAMAKEAIDREISEDNLALKKVQREKAKARLVVIDKMISKLYLDNAEGRLADNRLEKMVADLEAESDQLSQQMEELNPVEIAADIQRQYDQFAEHIRRYTDMTTLDREKLVTFVDRIEVGPKILEGGAVRATHRNQPYRQSIRIFYRFIGELNAENAERALPIAVGSL
mgnify:FL=1